jgi:hypothetical protein
MLRQKGEWRVVLGTAVKTAGRDDIATRVQTLRAELLPTVEPSSPTLLHNIV